MLEKLPLGHCQAIGFGNDGHDVDDLAQLLEDDDVDWSESVAGRVDEEEAAVDARVLDVAVADGGELLAEVGAVLVFDVFDDRVPATGSRSDEVVEDGVVMLLTIPRC